MGRAPRSGVGVNVRGVAIRNSRAPRPRSRLPILPAARCIGGNALARHAGFGTVATITEAAVNEAIASYLGGYLGPIKFPFPGPFTIAGTTVTLGGFLQMLTPTVELHPTPADVVRVQF